jgi:hypothetical protein
MPCFCRRRYASMFLWGYLSWEDVGRGRVARRVRGDGATKAM